MFIELTYNYGRKVTINCNNIISVNETSNGKTLVTTDAAGEEGNDVWTVEEPYSYVKSLIEAKLKEANAPQELILEHYVNYIKDLQALAETQLKEMRGD